MFRLSSTFVAVETPDTRSLLDKARGGDADAFCEICRECQGRLVRSAMTLCGNEAMAEELAQDTMVEAWRCLRKYNGRCQFFTWVCAILLNRFRNAQRGRRFALLEIEDCEEAMPDEQIGPDQVLARGEEAAAVRRCIAALSPKLRQVIFLRFYVDDSLPEIAAALGCSVGTVKSRLFNAMEKLRRMNLRP